MSASAGSVEPIAAPSSAGRARPEPVPAPPTSGDAYVLEVEPSGTAVRLAFDASAGSFRYQVEEPALDAREREALSDLDRALPRILAPSGPTADRQTLADALALAIDEYLLLHHPSLSPSSRERVRYYRWRDALGLGPIDAILRDPEVEDISCDGPGVPVFVYHARFESLRTNVEFESEEKLRGFVVHLAQRCGSAISVARPLLDGVTPEGHRVHATYGSEVNTRGSSFTIRRFRDRPFTPVDLVRTGTASAELVAQLWLAVEQGESLIICGGPGAGKTSTLNALTLFIPRRAKIASIEDTRELSLLNEHWVPSVTHGGSVSRGEGRRSPGEVDMYDLLAAALRQRPSYILVGEVRGPEAVTMFQAMATGHATYATMHADSVRSMVARLESPPIRVPRALFGSLRHVLIEVQRRAPGGVVRRLTQLVEIGGIDAESDELVTGLAFRWDAETDAFPYQGHSELVDRVAAQRGVPVHEVEADLARRAESLRAMARAGLTDARTIREEIERFSLRPAEGDR